MDPSIRTVFKQYKKDLDEGIITEKDFERLKNLVLDEYETTLKTKKTKETKETENEQETEEETAGTEEETEEEQETKYYLNTVPCQFPQSKTSALIESIKQNLEKGKLKGIYQIHFIALNNSTAEVNQLNGRLQKKFGDNRIFNICCKSDIKNPIFALKKQIKDFLKSRKDPCHSLTSFPFPLAVLFCPSPQAKLNCKEIIDIIRNKKIKVDIHTAIDEADKNEAMIKYWLNSDIHFTSVQLITATPTKDLFRITQNTEIANLQFNLTNQLSYQDAYKQYHKFEDNEIILKSYDIEMIDFVKNILEIDLLVPAFDNNLIIFCPGDYTIVSHKHIIEIFKLHGGYNMLLFGTEKIFILADGTTINYDKYAKKVSNNTEISNILAAFIKEYPGNFVVVGNYCVMRGITFNNAESGFHFTDAIYHRSVAGSKNVENLEQILHRSAGNKLYCKKHRVYISNETLSMIKEKTGRKNILYNCNPEKYRIEHFNNSKIPSDDLDYIICKDWNEVKAFGDKIHNDYPFKFRGFDTRNRKIEPGKNLFTGPMAEDKQLVNGNNPRIESVVMNPPQFNLKNRETMNAVPLEDYTWCVIWRNSFFENVNLKF